METFNEISEKFLKVSDDLSKKVDEERLKVNIVCLKVS